MKNKHITVALAGNPNSGKSTIFNNLTGARQHVGNYPGVTVEKKEGSRKYKGYDITFIDLPGTYGLSTYTEDAAVASRFLLSKQADIVLNVIDSTNLEKNLYFLVQLSELDIKLVVAMNMTDIISRRGIKLDLKALSEMSGSPVIETTGNKNKGTAEILDSIIELYEAKQTPHEKVILNYGDVTDKEIEDLAALIKKDERLTEKYPPQWLAMRLLEDDEQALDIIKGSENACDICNYACEAKNRILEAMGKDAQSIIAEKKYAITTNMVNRITVERSSTYRSKSDMIDKIVLNRFLGIPIFALVMYLIFKFTFTFSGPLVSLFEGFFGWLGDMAVKFIPEGLFQSLVVDGIIGGVGGVLGFFPLVLLMFFAIAFFEDSGYMARAAFVMDRLMAAFGMHGKSFLPMIIATNGCAVPAIMATRTLESNRDRLITMLVVPFMICGAKLPIFLLFIGAFFPKEQGANIMFIMYLTSVIIALSSAKVLSKTVFKEAPEHFLMELPSYHVPSLKSLLLKMWERGWLYIKKAGTIVLMLSIVIWAAFTFPQTEAPQGASAEVAATVQMDNSIAGRMGNAIEPVVKVIGLDKNSGIALISGLAAKEIVVSTFGTLYSLSDVSEEEHSSLTQSMQQDPNWNKLKAIVFLVFSLIYIPCIVAVSVFYRETGSSLKWLTFLVVGTTVMAYVASFVVYKVGLLFGWGV